MKADALFEEKIQYYVRPAQTVQSSRKVSIGQLYNYIKGDGYLRATQALRSLTDEKERKQCKSTQFDFVCFSGLFSYRKDQALIKHSNLLCLDFDHLGEQRTKLKSQLIADPSLETALLFTSPGGDGLKWVVEIDTARTDHRSWFRAIRRYLLVTYGQAVDEKCINESRACFLPHDPEVYVHPLLFNHTADPTAPARVFDLSRWLPTPSPTDDIYRVAEQLITQRIDITAGYQRWLTLGFALADGLGEQGRALYHRLSSFHSDYDYAECDRQFTACLQGKRSGVTIKSFFHYAKEAGVDLHWSDHANQAEESLCQKCQSANGTNYKKIEKNSVFEGLGQEVPVAQLAQLAQTGDEAFGFTARQTFSDKLSRHDIPSFLWPLWDAQTDAVGRDKMLLGTLSVVSGLLPPSLYSLYDGRKIFAPLYNIVWGHFATSKGDLEAVKQLVKPIKAEMKRAYEKALTDYQEKMAVWEASDKKRRGPQPKEPVCQSPFLPANSSASAIYRALQANGGWGLMFETEADTLTNMLSRKEYGDYTDLLRKVHHHEEISMQRVAENIFIEIEKPRMSVFLTCTGSQIPLLLPPGNVANGLASRFLFYELPDEEVEFRDVFARNEMPMEELCQAMGLELLSLYHALQDRLSCPLQFIMSNEQQNRFVTTFSEVLSEQAGMWGKGIKGYVYRLALECYRYSMTLTALRRLSVWNREESIFDEQEQALLCDERDFQTAMTIIQCLVNHMGRVYAVIGRQDDDPFSKAAVSPSAELKRFYQALPVGREFHSGEAVEIAKRFSIPERTAKRHLGALVNQYVVLLHPRHGVYQKGGANSPLTPSKDSTQQAETGSL